MKYINRQMEKTVETLTKQYPAIMICGQRQTGKSTMLRHLAEPDRKYVTFGDSKTRALAKNDPELFFETFGTKLIIDEFQRAPKYSLKSRKSLTKKPMRWMRLTGCFGCRVPKNL